MADLSTLADEILMSQNAAHRSIVSTAVQQQQQHPEVHTDNNMPVRELASIPSAHSLCFHRIRWNICSYHKKFGSSVRRCVHGCKWT